MLWVWPAHNRHMAATCSKRTDGLACKCLATCSVRRGTMHSNVYIAEANEMDNNNKIHYVKRVSSYISFGNPNKIRANWVQCSKELRNRACTLFTLPICQHYTLDLHSHSMQHLGLAAGTAGRSQVVGSPVRPTHHQATSIHLWPHSPQRLAGQYGRLPAVRAR